MGFLLYRFIHRAYPQLSVDIVQKWAILRRQTQSMGKMKGLSIGMMIRIGDTPHLPLQTLHAWLMKTS